MQLNGLPPRLAYALQTADARTKAQGIEPDDTDPRWNETLSAEFAKAMREYEQPTAHGPRIHRHNADPDCADCGGTGRYTLTPADCGSVEEAAARGVVACRCTQAVSLDHSADGWEDATGATFDDVRF